MRSGIVDNVFSIDSVSTVEVGYGIIIFKNLNSGVFKYGRSSPLVSGVKLAERKVICKSVFLLGVIMNTGQGLALKVKNNILLVNTAELVVLGIGCLAIICELAVIVVSPITEINLYVLAGKVFGFGNAVPTDCTDKHSTVTVLIILIVSANVVVTSSFAATVQSVIVAVH